MLLTQTHDGLTVIAHDLLTTSISSGKHKPYLDLVYDRIISTEDVVVEVGAYIGTQTTNLAKRAKKVYAFEPCSMSFEILKKNISDGKYSNVVLSSIALGEIMNKQLYMYIPKVKKETSFISTASLYKQEYREKLTNSCVVFPLDSFQHNLEKISTIILDTDQNDEILKGAKKVIDIFQPYIISLNNSQIPEWLTNEFSYTVIPLNEKENDFLFIPSSKLEKYTHQ